MRRILLLLTDLQIGGTPAVVRELALRLTAAGGAYVEVACLAPWGPVADQIARAGIRVTALNARSPLNLPQVVLRLARLIRASRFDTVFSFLIHANATAAAASVLCPRVRFLQSIQTTQPWPRWHWKVQAVVQRRAERIIVPSPSVAAVARTWARIPPEKIVVIPNAVPCGTGIPPVSGSAHPQDFSPKGAMKHGQDAHATKVGFIGRLDPIKRIPDLLHAMTLLEPPIQLDIFGEGAERPKLEQLIIRLGLTERVTLHGAIPQPHSALAATDLLVLPSQTEGFGLVLIEAMAAGVPVVATDVPGIRDVVRNGETGVLVPVGSPARLAEEIGSLLRDEPRRKSLIARAYQDVRERFSWDVVVPQYRKVLWIGSESAR